MILARFVALNVRICVSPKGAGAAWYSPRTVPDRPIPDGGPVDQTVHRCESTGNGSGNIDFPPLGGHEPARSHALDELLALRNGPGPGAIAHEEEVERDHREA